MSQVSAQFVLAVGLLLLAHIVRTVRWAFLFPPDYLKRRFDLLLGLALGYSINALVPFRIGELVRIYYVHKRAGVRLAYVAATVLAERLTDVVVVALILMAASQILGRGSAFPLAPVIMLIAAGVVVLAANLVRKSGQFRRNLWSIFSIFNNRIRFFLADLTYSFTDIVSNSRVMTKHYVACTVAMWALYIASYLTLANAISAPFEAVLYGTLGEPLNSTAGGTQLVGDDAGLTVLLFAALPVLGVIAFGFFWKWSEIVRELAHFSRYGGVGIGALSASQRDHFKAETEYEFFLASLFSGSNELVTNFGLNAIGDALVVRMFRGGSDAVTALVQTNDHLVIRKFATGDAAGKLRDQTDWLRGHACGVLPLTGVIFEHRTPQTYFYDMPFVATASDFYDVIHTSDFTTSARILEDVYEACEALHRQTARGDADAATVDEYLEQKAIKNARTILDFVRQNLLDGAYRINGVDYDLADWDCLLDRPWLKEQVRDRRTAIIHGDLTIENIIVSPGAARGWYIIDPNPDNIFNSPLIDWSKLMQSVHLGYEGLNRMPAGSLSGVDIQVPLIRSLPYSRLHENLEDIIRRRLNPDGLREVYFHELINYLRLTPYRIRRDPAKAAVFFACTSLLLRRYLEMAR